MLIDWNSLNVVHLGPGALQRQVELGRLFVALQEFDADDPQQTIKTHSHPHRQAGYVLEGELELLLGEQVYEVKAGQAYVIPPNVPHGAKARTSLRLLGFYICPGADYIPGYRSKNSPERRDRHDHQLG